MAQTVQTGLISVIMPAYNASRTIGESIDSVIRQTHQEWELIVIDDGSKDNTRQIAAEYSSRDKRVLVHALRKNAGLPNARNEGIALAKGEFVAFLDSDDLWHPEKLTKQVNFHRNNPHINISHTDYLIFSEHGEVKRRFKKLIDSKRDKEGNIYPAICYKNPIGVLTVMVRKSVLIPDTMFDVNLRTFEDQDLWIRLAKKGELFGFVNETLASYRVSAGGIMQNLGRYKRAYKMFLKKILVSPELNSNKAWRHYYRYFGTAYFRRRAFNLAQLYFWKSIKLLPFDLIAFTTMFYLSLTWLRSLGSAGSTGRDAQAA